MNKKIALSISDIQLINTIIFPDSEIIIFFGAAQRTSMGSKNEVVFILDKTKLAQFINNTKKRFTLVNYSSAPLNHLETHILLAGILDLSKTKKLKYQKYFFINNPDRTVRWFFPANNRTPCFLNLYNGSGLKANLFIAASKFLNIVKGLSAITDGQFSIFHKKNESYKSNFSTVSFDDFAVFTGTIGENRKAIISLSSNGKATQFVKVPLTPAALTLVENEFRQLDELGKHDYKITIVPDARYHDAQIMVSNISPHQKDKNQDWSTIHWKSLAELYKNSYQQKSMIATPFWKTITEGIRFLKKPFSIKNGLSVKEIQSLKILVEQTLKEINPTHLFPLGIGHGDFTPWNMYVGKDRLHIYDWEMSQSEFPLLFDMYHYFFQKGILITRENFQTIWKNIQHQLNDKNAQQLISSYHINQDQHLKIYLLYIVCYYLPKYMAQPRLHDQVHWLVATWLEAFQSIQYQEKI